MWQDAAYHLISGEILSFGGFFRLNALAVHVVGGDPICRFVHMHNEGRLRGRTGRPALDEPQLKAGRPAHSIAEVRHVCCDRRLSWRPKDGLVR